MMRKKGRKSIPSLEEKKKEKWLLSFVVVVFKNCVGDARKLLLVSGLHTVNLSFFFFFATSFIYLFAVFFMNKAVKHAASLSLLKYVLKTACS